MSQNPQPNSNNDALANATDYDVAVDASGSVRIHNENHHYTAYGKRNGGSTALQARLIAAKGVAIVGIWPLIFVFSTCLHMSGLPVLTIIVSWLALVVLYDIVTGFMYIKPRRMLKILAATTAWAVVGLGLIFGLYYLLAHA